MSSGLTHHYPVDDAVARWLQTLRANTAVCVAYSGGVDSSVLLHALWRATQGMPRGERLYERSVSLSALHVHHGLSPNANQWAASCESHAQALGVSLHIANVSVNHCERDGVEAAARNARYDAFAAYLAAHPTATIVLAHHALDQAETLLLQLLRGAGPAGLAAMPEAHEKFARPLLRVSKTAIDDYAQQHAISHIVDESNDDAQYARNRLRHHVWPALARAFPAAETTLARSARWQHEADQLAHELARIDLATCRDDWGLSISKWRALSSARRRNVLRHWLAELGIATQSAARVDDWERQVLESGFDTALSLRHASFAGSVRRYRDSLCIVSSLHDEAHEFRVAWHGETRLMLPHGELEISPTQTLEDVALFPISSNAENPILLGRKVFFVSSRNLTDTAARPGKKVDCSKVLFQKYGVPPWLRACWPTVEIEGEIVALAGLGRFERLDTIEDYANANDPHRTLSQPLSNAMTSAKLLSLFSIRWRPRGVPDAVQFTHQRESALHAPQQP